VAVAAEAGVRTEFETYALTAADDGLAAIASDAVRGAAVLKIAYTNGWLRRNAEAPS
jgi:hypothetical protein